MHKNYAKFYQNRIRINNPLNMTKEIIKQALFEFYKEQEEAPRLLTVSEVAKHHRVTSRTILNKIHQGRIEYKRIGNSYRIPSEHLNNIR